MCPDVHFQPVNQAVLLLPLPVVPSGRSKLLRVSGLYSATNGKLENSKNTFIFDPSPGNSPLNLCP